MSRVMSRNQSIMMVQSNPLETIEEPVVVVKVENLSDAVPIDEVTLKGLVNKLSQFEENADKLKTLEESKVPFLFASDDLAKIIEVTTSVKTRIAMIGLIGPRLTDPKSKLTYFTGLFRFTEEKQQVEEILKARVQTMNSTAFTKVDTLRGGAAGRGSMTGRGRGGRGSAIGTRTNAEITPATGSAVFKAEEEAAKTSAAAVSSRSEPILHAPTLDSGDSHVVSGVDGVFSEIDKISAKGDRGSRDSLRPMSSSFTFDSMQSPVVSMFIPKVGRSGSVFEFNYGNSSPMTDNDQSSTNSEDPKAPSTPAMSLKDYKPLPRLPKKEEPAATAPKKNLASIFQNAEEAEGPSQRRFSLKSISRDAILSEVQTGIVKNKMNSFTTRALPPTPPVIHTGGVKHAKSFQMGESSTGSVGETKSVFNRIVSGDHSEQAKILLSTESSHNLILNNDLASKCAAALKISRSDFLALSAEEPKVVVDGVEKFTYKELVRRNFVKDYTGLLQNELERHLAEDEFVSVFQKDSTQFYAQARWKQLDQKKKALLF